MAITVECTCGKRFNVKDEWAGEEIQCQVCQNNLTVPHEGMTPEVEAAAVPETPAMYTEPEAHSEVAEETVMCDACAEPIPADSIVCSFCGEKRDIKYSREKLLALLQEESEKLDSYTSYEENLENDKKLACSLFGGKSITSGIFMLIGAVMVGGGIAMRDGEGLIVFGVIWLIISGICALVSVINDLATGIKNNEKALKAFKGYVKGIKTNRYKKAFTRLTPSGRNSLNVTYPEVSKIAINTKQTSITSIADLKKYWKGILHCCGGSNRNTMVQRFRVISGGKADDKYAVLEADIKITTYPSWLIFLILINLLICVLVIVVMQKSEKVTLRKLLIKSNGRWYLASGDFKGVLDNIDNVNDL